LGADREIKTLALKEQEVPFVQQQKTETGFVFKHRIWSDDLGLNMVWFQHRVLIEYGHNYKPAAAWMNMRSETECCHVKRLNIRM